MLWAVRGDCSCEQLEEFGVVRGYPYRRMAGLDRRFIAELSWALTFANVCSAAGGDHVGDHCCPALCRLLRCACVFVPFLSLSLSVSLCLCLSPSHQPASLFPTHSRRSRLAARVTAATSKRKCNTLTHVHWA